MFSGLNPLKMKQRKLSKKLECISSLNMTLGALDVEILITLYSKALLPCK